MFKKRCFWRFCPNANKNDFKFKISKKQDAYAEIIIAVSNMDDNCGGLMPTLNSLGFEIKKMERKVLWTLLIDSKHSGQAIKVAEKSAENLLVNKHYQDYKIIGG